MISLLVLLVLWLAVGVAAALYRSTMSERTPRWVLATIIAAGPVYMVLPIFIALGEWVWGWRRQTQGIWLIVLGFAGFVHSLMQ